MTCCDLFNETHAYDYAGCAGFPLLQTPTADALAADGLMFEQMETHHGAFRG